MPENSIGVLPTYGLNPKVYISKKCYAWLAETAEKHNIYIQHGKNIGEYKVGYYYLDGICFENKTIYECNGCLFHGCAQCYSPDSFNSHLQCKNSEVFARHITHLNKIRKLTPYFTIVEMWEHHFESKKIIVIPPLNPRQASFGGRTECLRLYN